MSTLVVLGAQAAIAACSTALLVRHASRRGFGGRAAVVLFASASLLLPLVGPLALALLMNRLARPEARPLPRTVRVPLAGLADRTAAAGPGDSLRGNLEARLRFDPDPAHRVAAVLATRSLHAPGDAVRLLKLGLRDRHEDVRLMAHALLADRDRIAFREVDELERELAQAPDDRRGRLSRLLSEALSDVCAAGLVSGELENLTLRRARALLDGAR
jgi:hypothetical protein